jgi:hypothetical protein
VRAGAGQISGVGRQTFRVYESGWEGSKLGEGAFWGKIRIRASLQRCRKDANAKRLQPPGLGLHGTVAKAYSLYLLVEACPDTDQTRTDVSSIMELLVKTKHHAQDPSPHLKNSFVQDDAGDET